jgi:hypothetical protein
MAEILSEKMDSSVLDALGSRLRDLFGKLDLERRLQEIVWAEDLRQFKGIYDPETDRKIPIDASRVYPKLTRSKLMSVRARLHDMLFPDHDKNWGIEPTPVATVTQEILKKIVMSLVQRDPQSGQVVPPSDPQVQEAIRAYVRESCGRMETEIEDQLVECLYDEHAKRVLFSGMSLGTGVLKGPLVHSIKKDYWKPGVTEYEMVSKNLNRPYVEFVPIWYWYPDNTVTELHLCEGVFERHVLTKHALRQLAQKPKFNAQIINDFIERFGSGNAQYKQWELDLKTLKPETAQLPLKDRKYEVLEYWGFVDGDEMRAAGADIPDDQLSDEMEASVWLLDRHVVKCVANPVPKAKRPYSVFYFDKDESSIWGTSLPRVMRDSQISVSAAARMVLDNGACVAGPQVELNTQLLTPDNDLNSFHARKIWWRDDTNPQTAQYPAIRALEFDSHITELVNIIETFKRFADEETTFPTYMLAEPARSDNETAKGSSIKAGTISMSIKDLVKHFDAFNEDFIRRMYEWNMEFSEREDIKGDYKIKATGTASLMTKEIRTQALDYFAQTLTPEERVYIKKYEFLKERLKIHDLNFEDLLYSEEEALKIMQDQQDPRMLELQVDELMADIEKKKAMALSLLAKAKKVNTEAQGDEHAGGTEQPGGKKAAAGSAGGQPKKAA